MVDMLDRDNQHLFLEDEETDGGSFIANVNLVADNISILQELNSKLTPAILEKLEELIGIANG